MWFDDEARLDPLFTEFEAMGLIFDDALKEKVITFKYNWIRNNYYTRLLADIDKYWILNTSLTFSEFIFFGLNNTQISWITFHSIDLFICSLIIDPPPLKKPKSTLTKNIPKQNAKTDVNTSIN